MIRLYRKRFMTIFLFFFVLIGTGQAAPITFFGEDLNFSDNLSTPEDDPIRLTALTNSNGARNAFLANLNGVATETFDNFSPGTSPSVLSFGGDNATLFGNPIIQEVSSGTFNGTYPISGNNFLFHFGPVGSFQVTFDAPQAAFGFYATDLGDGGAQLILSLGLANGGTEVVNVPHSTSAPIVGPNNISGSSIYFGVIDIFNPFMSVTFTNTLSSLDGFGFDEMTIANSGQVHLVPEPSTISLLFIGGFFFCVQAFTCRNKITKENKT